MIIALKRDIGDFALTAGLSRQAVENALYDLDQALQPSAFIAKDQDQALQQDELVLPIPGPTGYPVLPMKKHCVAELVIAPQGGVMRGMHESPHQNIFFEFADLVKNFRRRHFDDPIAPTPQTKAKFDIYIVHKKALVKISRNFESPWRKEAA